MQPFLHRHIHIFIMLFCITASIDSRAQLINKPQLSQSTSSGTQTNSIAVPPAINVNTSELFNYQRNYVPKVPIDDPAQLTTSSAPSDVQVSTQYLDGFARRMEIIKHNFTPGKSLISPIDSRFRVTPVNYLPYSVTGFGFRANTFAEQRDYYNNLYPNEGNTAYTYTANTSNANKISATNYAPGKSQVGQLRGTEKTRITNQAGEIRNWTLDATGKPVSNGYYKSGVLFGEQSNLPGETGNSIVPASRLYKDREGRVVFQQATDTIGVLSSTPYTVGRVFNRTYYVYDVKGRLTYVIPPVVADAAHANGYLSQQELDQYCFQYRYDDKGRKIEQRTPGKGWEYFLYNKSGRLLMTQDSTQRLERQWSFSIGDALGRPMFTGIYNADISENRISLQTSMDDDGYVFTAPDLGYYLKKTDLYHTYPTNINNCNILSYTYYDDYREADPNGIMWNTWNSYKLQNTELYFPNAGAEAPQPTLKNLNTITGGIMKVLPSPGSSNIASWRRTAFFYDSKGRLIYSVSQDLDDNQNIIHASYSSNQYSFNGKVLMGKQVVVNQNSADGYVQHIELNKNEYEPLTGRLSKTWHKVDNASSWTLTSSIYYDELGRLQRKVLSNGGETQDYSYNIRGQLTGINGVYAETGNREFQYRSFGESLKYDYGFDKPRYDGKIAGMIWRGSNGANLGNNISHMHAYGYDYDLSGRLKLGDYYLQMEYNGQGQIDPWSKNLLDFTVSNLYYDRNGNIKSMKQRGVKPGVGPVDMDIMTYKYGNGNQLESVSDQGIADYGAGDFQDGNAGGGDYFYDGNGNLSKDKNKGIKDVFYNHFNKPILVTFDAGGRIEYSYDGAGNKVQELVFSPGLPARRTDYIGNFIYQNDSLQYALTTEGRTVFDYTNPTPIKEEYFIKDHLGNVRSIIDITVKPLQQYLASYEVASAYLEGMLFEKVSEIRDEKPASTDPGDTKAGRLNGAESGREVGTSLLVKVMAGDMVDMNVNNYYETFDGNTTEPVTPEQLMGSVISTLTSGVGGMPGESHNTKLVNELFTQENFYALEDVIQGQGIDPARPQAYLTYALFDENMKLVNEFSGAYQVNGSGTWGSIGSNGARVIPTNGFLAVYLNSRWRDLSCVPCSNVFFDKVVLEIARGSLLEENHYYPHGLPIKSLTSLAPGTKENRRKYQGNEYLKDFGMNWMDFHARQYDPQIGRFLAVDPLADFAGQQLWSPYAAMGNAPESLIDPNGTSIEPSISYGATQNKMTIRALDAIGGRGWWTGFVDLPLPSLMKLGLWEGNWGAPKAAQNEYYYGADAQRFFAEISGQRYGVQGKVNPGQPVPGTYEDWKKNGGEETVDPDSNPDPQGAGGSRKTNYKIEVTGRPHYWENFGLKSVEMSGMRITILYTGSLSGYSDVKWMQRVKSTGREPFMDGHDLPFYYTYGEGKTSELQAQNQDGTAWFDDSPGKMYTQEDYSFDAEVSLVGYKNGSYHSILNVNWGYMVPVSGVVIVKPYEITPPSVELQSEINKAPKR